MNASPGDWVKCVEPDADGRLLRGGVYKVERVWRPTTKGCKPHGETCRAAGIYLKEVPLPTGVCWCGARFARIEPQAKPVAA